MNEINILYTTDNNYVKYMMVSLLSLLENNKNFKRINIHIIYDGLGKEDFKRIEFIASNYGNCNIYFYPYNKNCNNYERSIPKWRGTDIANARLFFSNYIKGIDKLLYLDSDTLVVNSLDNLPKKQMPVTAALDHLSKKYWSNLDKSLNKYCNSGILWINLNEWDNKNCNEKISKTIEKQINVTFPDQDILNIALKDDIDILPLNYNLFSLEYYYDFNTLIKFYKINEINFYNKDDVKSAIANPIVLHLTDLHKIRPWQKNIIHPLNKEFDSYYFQMFNEKENSPHQRHSEYLLKFKDYLSIYVPKEIKNEIKKLIKK